MKIYYEKLSPQSLHPLLFDAYLEKGWYRMYQHIFTVTHWLNAETLEIDRVWWIRYHRDAIQLHDSHKKIMKKNRNLRVVFGEFKGITQEDNDLFSIYSASTDFEGYTSLARCLYGTEEPQQESLFDTRMVSVYDGQKLVARGLFDVGTKAVMGKINYFDPAYRSYSPSKFMILKIIEYMRQRNWEWFYPGYIIVGRPKFDYKLFLGKESAEYYDPDKEAWLPYSESIMQPETRTEAEQRLLIKLHILNLMGMDEVFFDDLEDQ